MNNKDIYIKIEFERGYTRFEDIVTMYNLKLDELKLSYNLENHVFEYNKLYYINDLIFVNFSRVDGKPIFLVKNITNKNVEIKNLIINSFKQVNLHISDIYLIPIIEDQLSYLKSSFYKRKNRNKKIKCLFNE